MDVQHGVAQSRTDFFRVKKDSTSKIYSILSGLTGSTAATAVANRAFSVSEIADTKPTFQDDGTVKTSFDNYEDTPEFLDFLNAINPPTAASASGKSEWKKENGEKRGGSNTSTNNYILSITYGIGYIEGTTKKIKMLVALGTIAKSSGSYSQKADDWSKPTLEFTGTLVTDNDLTIAAALFDPSIATDVALKIPEIPVNACYVNKFVELTA